MNKANLKSYAPKARLDFIKAVTERANMLGISAAGVVPAEVRGDVALVDGREWPVKVAGQRDELIARIKRHGFEQTMDEVAYTWFNRFAALRYMEIHDYLGHGWRVLSSRDGGLPEILRHASEVTLPGLNPDRAREMQLAGNQDNELYKLLLVAQCNELSRVMPFLFERIDDETELLLPENLLRTDSIVAKLVEQVPEEDWQEIEVIGWLYQFYISEKKDQVIGKVVKSEDIPAATQLFTPNWIVQYLVQNSVGRLWLMANPTSTLASQWPYYIQPAEQMPEVQAQLDALVQTRIREDGETLNPETITVLDPACGSGHILVVAYDVLKAIYLDRGYQPRTIPRLILEKNLYGLDIDDRSAQLAAFALLMKARADDRRLLDDPPKHNVLSLQESKGLDAEEFAAHLEPFGLQRAPLKALFDSFQDAKTFGSLVQIPNALNGQLAAMTEGVQQAMQSGDLYARQAAEDLLPLLWQALVLGMQFDSVVANPPYMGGKGMNQHVKDFTKSAFPNGKLDLFAAFIERGFLLGKPMSSICMVTMQSWIFLSSFENLRRSILQDRTIASLVHIGYNSFPELNSKIAQACAFCILKTIIQGATGRYVNLNSAPQNSDKSEIFLARDKKLIYDVRQSDFFLIPGSPLAYWAPPQLLKVYATTPQLYESTISEGQNITANNGAFVRHFWEVDAGAVGKGKKWINYAKGGPYRRWYGNQDIVVDWSDSARENYRRDSSARIIPERLWFKQGITWTLIASTRVGFRVLSDLGTFDKTGSSIFLKNAEEINSTLAFLNSRVADYLIDIYSSTITLQVDEVRRLPFRPCDWVNSRVAVNASTLIDISRRDWEGQENAQNFRQPYFVTLAETTPSIEGSWRELRKVCDSNIQITKSLEEANNRIFIDAYGLDAELSAEVPEDHITLARADREVDSQRLISYAIGCTVGRYSLDEPGLIYAHAGNIGFDPRRYEKKFPADADGIVPITDERWFEEDAANRVREFVRSVWGTDTLEENMAWLAESLGAKASETPDETIRRYISDKFFKDHLQTYKKRPIYWLFSSGKQGAFQALVYLHRYNEGTLARMRAEYVVPLIAKMVSRLDMLEQDVDAALSSAARTKLQKQIEALRKKQIELLAYDEKLRHYADMRITLDLDDGVKINYAKFGDLVAEAKAITGGKDED